MTLEQHIPATLIEFVQMYTPIVTALLLIYVGYNVEKHYVSRPALVANGGAMFVFYLTYIIPNSDRVMAVSREMVGSTLLYVGLEGYVLLSGIAAIAAGAFGMTDSDENWLASLNESRIIGGIIILIVILVEGLL